MPLVSLVLPTYNGARYLASSLESCLAQTFTDFELIVVLDGGTDESESIVRGYADPRIVVHRTENQGLPSALNTGFALAKGRYLGWTSDDNLYLPDALATMVAHLDSHPGAAMVCTDCYLIDDDGRTFAYTDTVWACFLYRREAAEATGPYRPEFRLVEDVDFFLRLQHYAGPIDRIAAPHYRYRMHRQSLSATQLSRRHLASLRLHHDLVTRGVEQLDLHQLFVDRLEKCAMNRKMEGVDEVLDFARQVQVPFVHDLERRARVLRTLPGWLVNRSRIALRSRVVRFQKLLRLVGR